MNKYFILYIFLLHMSTQHVAEEIKQGNKKIRGTNLGGWLVAEHWMTYDSVIWEGVSDQISNTGEYSTMQYLGHSEGDLRFQKHHETWIQEEDIKQIAESGLNTVRVPIGYWIAGFDNQDPSGKQEWKTYAPNALFYLDRLITNWARKYNIAVLVNIHGAKGSQNGFDHSSPPNPGSSYWSSYPENVANTLELVQFLQARYKNEEAYLGIGLLNEPAGSTSEDVLRTYYLKAYEDVRKIDKSSLLSVSPLLWEQGVNNWDKFARCPHYHNVIHEWHKYLIWGFEDWDAERLISEGTQSIKNDIQKWTGNPLIIGEWSLASAATFTEEQFDRYIKAYTQTFSEVHWVYWTWKVSGDKQGENNWSMRNLIGRKGKFW